MKSKSYLRKEYKRQWDKFNRIKPNIKVDYYPVKEITSSMTTEDIEEQIKLIGNNISLAKKENDRLRNLNAA